MSKIKRDESILRIYNPHIIILLLLLISATVSAAPVLIAGRYVELSIIPVSDHTIRITLLPVEADEKNKKLTESPVLVSRDWPCPAMQSTELKDVSTVMLEKFRITVRRTPLTINIDTKQGKAVQQLAFDERNGCFTFRLAKGPVFGLGVGAQQFDRRGAFYPMKSGMYEWDLKKHGARLAIPFILGTDGWAMFVHQPYGTFDLRDNPGRFAPASKEHALPVDVFIIHAEQPSTIMREYIAVTGRHVMPPKWGLGFLQSHRTLAGPDEVFEVAQTFRRKELPCDGLIYLGTGFCPAGWNTGHNSLTFNPKTFDKPAEIINQLHELNFHIILHVSYPPKDLHGRIPPEPDEKIDPNHIAAYWARHKKAFGLGVDGWWPDTGQEMSIEARLARHRMYYDGALAERPGQRPFNLYECAGYAGMQRYGGWIRTGDICGWWTTLEKHISIAINSSLSGVPYWGCCTGGFYPNRQLTGELFARWFQFSSFTPYFQSHGRTWHTRLPWGWNTGKLGPQEGCANQCGDSKESDVNELHNPHVEPICRKYLNLRYELMPYLYTLSRETYDTGMPIMRAMWLHYPDDHQAVIRGDQYLWGRDILVAPVNKKGATCREVYLPKGIWYDFWTSEKIVGGQQISRPVDLTTMPLYVRAGAILPFAPVHQYVEQPTYEPTTLRIYTGRNGEFTLYEDDGISLDYQNDLATWTRFAWNDANRQLIIEPDKRSTIKPAHPTRFDVLLIPDNTRRSIQYTSQHLELKF